MELLRIADVVSSKKTAFSRALEVTDAVDHKLHIEFKPIFGDELEIYRSANKFLADAYLAKSIADVRIGATLLSGGSAFEGKRSGIVLTALGFVLMLRAGYSFLQSQSRRNIVEQIANKPVVESFDLRHYIE